jgi:hypothetical protein
MKNNPQNNFSTIEPIFTNNTPIDSAQQAKTHGNIQNSPRFHLGEKPGNFHEKDLLQ